MLYFNNQKIEKVMIDNNNYKTIYLITQMKPELKCATFISFDYENQTFMIANQMVEDIKSKSSKYINNLNMMDYIKSLEDKALRNLIKK